MRKRRCLVEKEELIAAGCINERRRRPLNSRRRDPLPGTRADPAVRREGAAVSIDEPARRTATRSPSGVTRFCSVIAAVRDDARQAPEQAGVRAHPARLSVSIRRAHQDARARCALLGCIGEHPTRTPSSCTVAAAVAGALGRRYTGRDPGEALEQGAVRQLVLERAMTCARRETSARTPPTTASCRRAPSSRLFALTPRSPSGRTAARRTTRDRTPP